MKIWKILIFGVLIVAVVFVGIIVVGLRKPAAPKDYWKTIENQTTGMIEKEYNHLGDYEVKKRQYPAPSDERDKTENHFAIWSPKEEGEYPLIIMVNGTGVPDDKYEEVFRHLASYGYVVAGNNYGTNWDGLNASRTLDFVLETQEIADKIDREKIAIGGHSQGGMGAFNAVTEYENGSLYKAVFSLSPTSQPLAESLKWGFDLSSDHGYAYRTEDIDIPVFMAAGTGKFDSETISPLEEMRKTFDALQGDKVMVHRSDEVDHGAMLYEANGYVLAWLDHYLKGKEENQNAFFGPEAEQAKNPRYQDFASTKKDE